MSWIKTIDYQSATGRLKKMYDRIKGPSGVLDNVLTIHSLRPHTLEAHMIMYKAVIHHSKNTLPKWYLEYLGTYVSTLNQCEYCSTHHAVGFKRNLNDDEKYVELMTAIQTEHFFLVLENKYAEGMLHAKLLTTTAHSINQYHIENLKKGGFSEGEILEINQVVSYFNYVNRTVVGLGVHLEEDNIGLSPQSGDVDDWGHS